MKYLTLVAVLFCGNALAGQCEYYDPAIDDTVKAEMTQAECDALGGEFKASPAPSINYDLNGDGVVSFADYLHASRSKYGLCTPAQDAANECAAWPWTAFDSADFNGDAYISLQELTMVQGTVCILGTDAQSKLVCVVD